MKLELEDQDVQVVIDALAERPLKVAYNAFTRIMAQVGAQRAASTEVPKSAVDGVEPQA